MVFDPLTDEMGLAVYEVCQDATAVVRLCANGHIACPNCISAVQRLQARALPHMRRRLVFGLRAAGLLPQRGAVSRLR